MRYFCYAYRNMRFAPLSLLLLSGLLPAHAAAASLRTQDTIAGLQTEVTLFGFPASGAVDVMVETPDGARLDQTLRADAGGEAVAVIAGGDTERAGAYRVVAESGNVVAQGTFTVLPDRLSVTESSMAVSVARIAADGVDTAVIDVTLRDRFQNPLPDRPVTLIPSRTDDVVQAEGDVTDERGKQRFRVATELPGTVVLRAMDLLSGMIVEDSASIAAGDGGLGNADPWTASVLSAQVTGGSVIDRFELTIPSSMEIDKEASKITVRAVDRSGRTVENYTGTVRFSSSDATATLPNFGTYAFKPRDLGQKEFPLILKFRKTGQQTVRVEDAEDPSIFGAATTTVTGRTDTVDPAERIAVTSPKAGQTIGGTEVKVEGNGPALINIVVKGGVRSVTTETDQNGRFSATVSLDPAAPQATLTAEDEDGRYGASDPVQIRVDAIEPTVTGVTFTPPTPETGAQTLVLVKSEPKLRAVTMSLARNGQAVGQPLTLLENSNAPGSYQTFFTAPEVGSYQPIFQTTDDVGNNGRYITDLTVQAKALPVVQGLRGEARSDSVLLQWGDVEADVTGYRVYIGEAENDLPFTLDTNVKQARATVKGLQPGKRYYFAVTAVKGEQESRARSEMIAVDTIGIRLSIAPQDTSLKLEWTGVPENLPLQSYVLEYGVAEGAYVEKRVVSGEAELYVLRDLINGVLYHLRLTPIAVTGERRDDLAVTGSGTPNGKATGFNPSGSDPIPGDLQPEDPYIGPGHEGAPPENTDVGLPLTLWLPVLALTSLIVGGSLYRRHQRAQTAAFLQALAQHRHH